MCGVLFAHHALSRTACIHCITLNLEFMVILYCPQVMHWTHPWTCRYFTSRHTPLTVPKWYSCNGVLTYCPTLALENVSSFWTKLGLVLFVGLDHGLHNFPFMHSINFHSTVINKVMIFTWCEEVASTFSSHVTALVRLGYNCKELNKFLISL